MLKSLVVLAMAGTMSVTAAAQTAPNAPTTNQAQAAKPQMVKKRVCENTDDDPYSRIHNRVCKTIEVPAQPGGSNGQQASGPAPQANSGN
jgi:hypothetical protein